MAFPAFRQGGSRQSGGTSPVPCHALPGRGLPTLMGPRAQAPLSSALSDSYSSHGRMFSIDLIRTLVLHVAEL